LRDVRGVRRELCRLYREGKAGRHDAQMFGRLVHALARIAAIDNATLLEARIEVLEQRLAAAPPRPNGSGYAARPSRPA
jgi:hypothetical protein